MLRRGRLLPAAVLFLAVLAVLATGERRAAAAAPIQLEEYADRVRLALEAARAGVAAPSPTRMDSVRDTLGLPFEVTVGGGTVTVDRVPALDGLEGRTAEDFRRAVGGLEGLLSGVREVREGTPLDPARTRAALEAAYRGLEGTGPGISGRIAEWIRQAVGWVGDGLSSLPAVGKVLLWGLGLALVAAAVWAVSRRGGLVPERRVEGPRGASAAMDWARMADEALARGDLDAAVRSRFRALVAALAARGLVRDVPNLTAGGCRMAVSRRRPNLGADVVPATLAFERVRYGRAEATLDDVAAIRRAEEAVRAR